MKLIFCSNCKDIVRLQRELRTCKCGESSGRYINNYDAEIEGNCIPLGFANSSLVNALKKQPQGPGQGKRFEAFVIPKVCDTIRRL